MDTVERRGEERRGEREGEREGEGGRERERDSSLSSSHQLVTNVSMPCSGKGKKIGNRN